MSIFLFAALIRVNRDNDRSVTCRDSSKQDQRLISMCVDRAMRNY